MDTNAEPDALGRITETLSLLAMSIPNQYTKPINGGEVTGDCYFYSDSDCHLRNIECWSTRDYKKIILKTKSEKISSHRFAQHAPVQGGLMTMQQSCSTAMASHEISVAVPSARCFGWTFPDEALVQVVLLLQQQLVQEC